MTARVRIGILGVGHLIRHLAPGLLLGENPPRITLAPRSAETAAALAARFDLPIATDSAGLVAGSDVVLVAVRPFQVEAAITGLPWRGDQMVISLCAGVPIAVYRRHIPEATLIRAMPVIAGEFGESPTCVFPHHPVAEALFSRCGRVIRLAEEREFEAASVIAAYYAWIQQLAGEVTRWLADTGLAPETARELVFAMTRAGATTTLMRPDESLRCLIEELIVPGSISGHGLAVLERRGAFAPWHEACDAVLHKLRTRS